MNTEAQRQGQRQFGASSEKETFGTTLVSGGGAATVQGRTGPLDLESVLERDGFYQDPDTKVVYLPPLMFWPGIVSLKHLPEGEPLVAPAPRVTIGARVRYTLGLTRAPEWYFEESQQRKRLRTVFDGSVATESVEFVHWSFDDSPPPNDLIDSYEGDNSLTWHFSIGTFDADLTFKRDVSDLVMGSVMYPFFSP